MTYFSQFPANPIDGQVITVKGKPFIYSASTRTWARSIGPIVSSAEPGPTYISGPNATIAWAALNLTYPSPPYFSAMALLERLAKLHQWYGYCDIIMAMFGEEVSPASVILKGPPAAIINGSPTANPGYGVSPDGLNTIDTGVRLNTLSNFSLNNNFHFIFFTSDIPTNQSDGGASGGSSLYIIGRDSLGDMQIKNNSAGAGNLGLNLTKAGVTAVGFAGSMRCNSSATVYMVKNELATPIAIASTTVPTSTFTTFGSGNARGSASQGMVFLGAFPPAWTPDQCIAKKNQMYQDCRAVFYFLNTLGSIEIPPAPPFTGPYPFSKTAFNTSDLAARGKMAIRGPGVNPPQDNSVTNTTYWQFPYTDVVGRVYGGNFLTTTATGFKVGLWIWDNRAYYTNIKSLQGNDTLGTINISSGGQQYNCRVRITDYALSRLTTRIQLAHQCGILPKADARYLVNGVPTGWLDMAKAGGIDTTWWDNYYATSANPATDRNFINPLATDPAIVQDTGTIMFQTRAVNNAAALFNTIGNAPGQIVATNIQILGQGRLADCIAPGNLINFDFEDDDSCPDSIVVAHMIECTRIANACGYKTLFCPDSLVQSGASNGLVQATAYQAIAGIDYLGIALTYNGINAVGTAVQCIDAQLAVFSGPNKDIAIPYTKVIPIVALGGDGASITYQQATDIHNVVISRNMAGIKITPGGGSLKSPATSNANQTQATLLRITPGT